VFCVKPIPRGINPFGPIGVSWDKREVIKFSDVEDVHPNVRDMMNDFYPYMNHEYHIQAPLNQINVAWYMNHSSDHNMLWSLDRGHFFASKDISIDEELLADYGSLGYERYLTPGY
jgi:hypothetical protein